MVASLSESSNGMRQPSPPTKPSPPWPFRHMRAESAAKESVLNQLSTPRACPDLIEYIVESAFY